MKKWIGALLAVPMLAACNTVPVALPQAPMVQVQAVRQSDPLQRVIDGVHQVYQQHGRPIVVFDLDDTLFRTAPRTLRILQDWAQDPAGQPFAAAIKRLTVADMAYSLDPVLTKIGVPQAQWPAVKQFWTDRFFTSEFLKFDTAYPGAVAFTKSVQQAGAQVVYLTGRFGVMRAGSEKALKDNGFAWDDGRSTTLLTKVDPAMKDMDFKVAQLKALQASGTIVASLDNEPGNVDTMQQVLPQSLVIFVDQPHSPNAPPVNAGILQVPGFTGTAAPVAAAQRQLDVPLRR